MNSLVGYCESKNNRTVSIRTFVSNEVLLEKMTFCRNVVDISTLELLVSAPAKKAPPYYRCTIYIKIVC